MESLRNLRPPANLEGKHGLPKGMAGKLTPERVITNAVKATSPNN